MSRGLFVGEFEDEEEWGTRNGMKAKKELILLRNHVMAKEALSLERVMDYTTAWSEI